MRRYKRILGIFLVSLAGLGVGIVILELIFGAWLSPSSLNRLNLIKGWTIEYDGSGLYQMESPIIYSRDKYGLRGAYGNDPSRIDLLTVGGSTTDQRYISDGSTWQDVLQTYCASIGTPLVVANAGVDGQSTFGHIKNFDWWFPYVPHLKPKYILFYIGLNDFYREREDSIYDRFLYGDRHSLVAAISENSVLWHLGRTIRGAYRAHMVLKIKHRKVDFASVQWTREPLQNDYEFMSSRTDAYAQRLRILVDRTRHFGSDPIFVTQPSRHFKLTKNGIEGRAETNTYENRQINGLDYYNMIRRFNNVMEAVCRERRAFCIDLAAGLEWEDSDFYDFAHMTPRGARKVGLYLCERFRNLVIAAEPGATLDKE